MTFQKPLPNIGIYAGWFKRNRDYDVDFDGYLFACWLAFRLRTILANPKVKGINLGCTGF